ncbi:MAG: hypothetical protein FWG59_01335, partial [Betaproteobacteria bacterium]|nr:hypothetical protein [Betaproteobacteria bacterium]
ADKTEEAGAAAAAEGAAQPEKSAEDAAKAAETAQPEPEGAARAQEAAPEPERGESYVFPLSGGEVTLSGDEACRLLETGIEATRRQDEVREALAFRERFMPLYRRLSEDAAFREHVKAYGRPPAAGQEAPEGADGGVKGLTEDEYMRSFRERVVRETAELLMPRINEHYQPFVDKVTAGLADAGMARYAADPDFAAVNAEMDARYAEVLTQAAMRGEDVLPLIAFKKALKTDPRLYGEVFGRAREALRARAGEKAVPQGEQAQPGQNAEAQGTGTLRTQLRAPRLESGGAVDSDAQALSAESAVRRALGSGNPEDIGKLFQL